MTNSEKIWIIVGIASFAGTIGLLVGLREIIYRVNSIPVHNRLRRTHGDIELNYIEPSNSHYPDLLESPAPIHERFLSDDRVPSFYTGQHAPSYFSGGNPPSFNTMDRIYINSSFEDNINLDYIFYIILFCVFLLLIRKLIISNQLITEKIIILLLLSIIYLQFGLLANIIIVFFLSNFLLWIDPNNTQLKVIRAMAIIVIIFIIFNNSLYNISILIPFSLFEIDFRDSFDWKYNSWKVKPKISYLKIQTLTKDLKELLESLNDDIDYSLGLSFIASYREWEKDKEKVHPLFINDAIIVNKESDPILITEFILKSLEDKKTFFY